MTNHLIQTKMKNEDENFVFLYNIINTTVKLDESIATLPNSDTT